MWRLIASVLVPCIAHTLSTCHQGICILSHIACTPTFLCLQKLLQERDNKRVICENCYDNITVILTHKHIMFMADCLCFRQYTIIGYIAILGLIVVGLREVTKQLHPVTPAPINSPSSLGVYCTSHLILSVFVARIVHTVSTCHHSIWGAVICYTYTNLSLDSSAKRVLPL